MSQQGTPPSPSQPQGTAAQGATAAETPARGGAGGAAPAATPAAADTPTSRHVFNFTEEGILQEFAARYTLAATPGGGPSFSRSLNDVVVSDCVAKLRLVPCEISEEQVRAALQKRAERHGQ